MRTTNERYSRQKDIVPPERIAACQATVIGVGAIGRQVALQLQPWASRGSNWWISTWSRRATWPAKATWKRIWASSRSRPPRAQCQRINSAIEIMPIAERFRRSMEIGNAVFDCVDQIDVRRLIWEAVRNSAPPLLDGRMSAEVLRVLTVCDSQSRRHYPTTLFRSEEAFVGACTAKTTIYCANIAAGMMLAQFTKYLRHLPVEPDIQLNLLASELSITDACP